MEVVSGIGGLFFRAHDPRRPGRCYQEHLGFPAVAAGDEAWQQDGEPTVFAAFEESTGRFGWAENRWMVNFHLRDLAAMTAQLRAAGITVEANPQTYPMPASRGSTIRRVHPFELWDVR